jgi:hypothetical protein
LQPVLDSTYTEKELTPTGKFVNNQKSRTFQCIAKFNLEGKTELHTPANCFRKKFAHYNRGEGGKEANKRIDLTEGEWAPDLT